MPLRLRALLSLSVRVVALTLSGPPKSTAFVRLMSPAAVSAAAPLTLRLAPVRWLTAAPLLRVRAPARLVLPRVRAPPLVRVVAPPPLTLSATSRALRSRRSTLAAVTPTSPAKSLAALARVRAPLAFRVAVPAAVIAVLLVWLIALLLPVVVRLKAPPALVLPRLRSPAAVRLREPLALRFVVVKAPPVVMVKAPALADALTTLRALASLRLMLLPLALTANCQSLPA